MVLLKYVFGIFALLICVSAVAENDECLRVEDSSAEGSWWESKASIMGTEVRVELWHQDEAFACSSIAAVMQEMRRPAVFDLISAGDPSAITRPW